MAGYEHDGIKALLRELDPKRFETLCFALLEAEGHTSVQHLGAGGGDRGVDILSRSPDGRCWATQCKRSQDGLAKKALLADLGKVLEAPPDPPPVGYLVATNGVVTVSLKEALQEKVRSAGSALELAFWDGTKVVQLLLDHPKIRGDYLPERPEPGPFWNVPNRTEFFVGREDVLSVLSTRLEAAGPRP